MEAKVTNAFAIPIYEVEYENFADIQQSLIDNIPFENKNEECHEHPVTGELYNVSDKSKGVNSQPIYTDLLKWCEIHAKKYWETLGFTELLEPHILSSWIGIQSKGGKCISHNHNPHPIGGVFYLKATSEQGDLVLENPLDLLIGRHPLSSYNNTLPTRLKLIVKATSGKLVLFPGWMKHYSQGNNTNEKRYAMALNYGCRTDVVKAIDLENT